MSKKSVNLRLEYAREHNDLAATKLLLQQDILSGRKVYKKVDGKYMTEVLNEDNNNCICNRKSQVIECNRCKKMYYGRKSEICPYHPKVSFLLDLMNCPSCAAPKEYLNRKRMDAHID